MATILPTEVIYQGMSQSHQVDRFPPTDFARYPYTLKEDLHCTAAELVYGTTLQLPGEYFHDSICGTNTYDLSNYETKLITNYATSQSHSPKTYC